MTFCSSPPLCNPILSTTIERWVWTPWIFKTVDIVSTYTGECQIWFIRPIDHRWAFKMIKPRPTQRQTRSTCSKHRSTPSPYHPSHDDCTTTEQRPCGGFRNLGETKDIKSTAKSGTKAKLNTDFTPSISGNIDHWICEKSESGI